LARWWGSVPAQNAFEERLLSLMAKQWTVGRNPLLVEFMKGKQPIKYRFKNGSCKNFQSCLYSTPQLWK